MDRTYEELKHRQDVHKRSRRTGLDRTYEELKLALLGCAEYQAVKGLDRTYEELKHNFHVFSRPVNLEFGSYL